MILFVGSLRLFAGKFQIYSLKQSFLLFLRSKTAVLCRVAEIGFPAAQYFFVRFYYVNDKSGKFNIFLSFKLR